MNRLGSEDDGYNDQRPVGETIMLSLARKIQVVRVGEDARVFKVRGTKRAMSMRAWADILVANRLRWEHYCSPERLYSMRCRYEELCSSGC